MAQCIKTDTECSESIKLEFVDDELNLLQIKEEFKSCDECLTKDTTQQIKTESELFQLNRGELDIPFDHNKTLCDSEYIVTDERIGKTMMKSKPSAKKYKCDLCPLEFNYPTNLLIHKKVQCGKTKPHPIKREETVKPVTELKLQTRYMCSICNREFPFESTLKRHKLIHLRVKPYACSVCAMRFWKRATLQVHKKRHTGEKEFKCDTCDMRFVDKWGLKVHYRKHTGEKPYLCTVCNRTFKTNTTLKSHKRTHTGEKPHVCTVCGKSTTWRSQLRRHKCVNRKIFKEDLPATHNYKV